MSIKKPAYQLTLELDLPEEGDEQNYNPQEAGLLLEGARRAFEQREEKPEWYEEYEGLIQGGWPFRVAMYIAWAASPREGRWPKTIAELAAVMGLKSKRVIYTWRSKNPAIDQTVSLMQAAPIFKHRADLFNAALTVAMDPDYKGHNDRKMLFEMLGDYERRSEINARLGKAGKGDLSEYSETELALLAGYEQNASYAHPGSEFAEDSTLHADLSDGDQDEPAGDEA